MVMSLFVRRAWCPIQDGLVDGNPARNGGCACRSWHGEPVGSNLGRAGIGRFFFSSGRRHTRCSRDWSSDVCSSDLVMARHHLSALGGDGVPSLRSSVSCRAFTPLEENSMTRRVRSAFGRFLALSCPSALTLLVVASSLAAQQLTGKVEGTVTGDKGAPIASAQVTIVGTSCGALTDNRGYYFINNVPIGSYTVRAKFIGYTAAEVPGVRVQGGFTLTV